MDKNNDVKKLENTINVLLEKLSRVYDISVEELKEQTIVIKKGNVTIKNK